jgi:hypothetical protein
MHRGLVNPGSWSTYQAAMLEVARPLAPLVAQLVPVKPDAKNCLTSPARMGCWRLDLPRPSADALDRA